MRHVRRNIRSYEEASGMSSLQLYSKAPVVLALVLSSFAVTACGKQVKFVKDVQVQTYLADQDVMARLNATLDTGKLQIPGITLPIINPKKPGVTYGTIGFAPALGGGSELRLDIDVTKAAGVEGMDGDRLPNGSPIPVGGLGDTPVIGLQVGANSKVYVAVGPGVALLGVALSIPQFDVIGSKIPIPVNLFPTFQLANGIKGIAGIFTGSRPGTSGVALFADASAALQKSSPQTTTVLSDLRAVDGARIQVQAKSRLYFIPPQPSIEHESAVQMGLYQLNRKRTRISVK
jgi:hypothetical protein